LSINGVEFLPEYPDIQIKISLVVEKKYRANLGILFSRDSIETKINPLTTQYYG